MRLITLIITSILLSACASAPESMSRDDVDAQRIADHQRSLANVTAWEFQSRMAFFELQQGSRQSASLRWHNAPTSRSLRVSHPLRGTLARLEETEDGAILTDQQGDEYYAADIQSLLLAHLNVVLPIGLIHDALLGRIPQTEIINPTFYADGTLAEYQVDVRHANRWWDNEAQTWQVKLQRYEEAANDPVRLPHYLELTSAQYEIHLNISRWTLFP